MKIDIDRLHRCIENQENHLIYRGEGNTFSILVRAIQSIDPTKKETILIVVNNVHMKRYITEQLREIYEACKSDLLDTPVFDLKMRNGYIECGESKIKLVSANELNRNDCRSLLGMKIKNYFIDDSAYYMITNRSRDLLNTLCKL